MSKRPFAVGGRLAVPSVYIAAEPGNVGAPLVSALRKAGTSPAPTWWSRCAKWEAPNPQVINPAAPEVLWPQCSHGRFGFGIDRESVTEGKSHGHESLDRYHRLASLMAAFNLREVLGGAVAEP